MLLSHQRSNSKPVFAVASNDNTVPSGNDVPVVTGLPLCLTVNVPFVGGVMFTVKFGGVPAARNVAAIVTSAFSVNVREV